MQVSPPCTSLVPLTAEAALDVANAAVELKTLQSVNREFKQRLAAERQAMHEAKSRIARKVRDEDQLRQELALLLSCLSQLNRALEGRREERALLEEQLKNEMLHSADAIHDSRIANKSAIHVENTVMSGQRNLDRAIAAQRAQSSERKVVDGERRKIAADERTARTRYRRVEAAKLRAELQSAALQRELSIARAAVAHHSDPVSMCLGGSPRSASAKR